MIKLLKYLRHGHHEAVAVTLREGGSPNPAPMGVDLGFGRGIILKPYLTTSTLQNLMRLPEVTLNFTMDSTVFLNALLRREDMNYLPARSVKPPVINGPIDLYVEGRVTDVEVDLKGGRASVYVEPITVYEGPGSSLAFSRVDSAMIEALIYLTKAEALIHNVGPEVISALLRKVSESLTLVERLGSDEMINAAELVRKRAASLGGILGGD